MTPTTHNLDIVSAKDSNTKPFRWRFRLPFSHLDNQEGA